MELPHDAPVGAAVRDYLGLDDCTIEVDLTPNRSDCLGVIGIARETGLLNDLDLTPPEMAPVEPTISDTFPVTLTAQRPALGLSAESSKASTSRLKVPSGCEKNYVVQAYDPLTQW